jgi:hypothetical protein
MSDAESTQIWRDILIKPGKVDSNIINLTPSAKNGYS